jgi:hypothetical protein
MWREAGQAFYMYSPASFMRHVGSASDSSIAEATELPVRREPVHRDAAETPAAAALTRMRERALDDQTLARDFLAQARRRRHRGGSPRPIGAREAAIDRAVASAEERLRRANDQLRSIDLLEASLATSSTPPEVVNFLVPGTGLVGWQSEPVGWTEIGGYPGGTIFGSEGDTSPEDLQSVDPAEVDVDDPD